MKRSCRGGQRRPCRDRCVLPTGPATDNPFHHNANCPISLVIPGRRASGEAFAITLRIILRAGRMTGGTPRDRSVPREGGFETRPLYGASQEETPIGRRTPRPARADRAFESRSHGWLF